MADLTGTKKCERKKITRGERAKKEKHVPESLQKKMKKQEDRGMSEWRLSGCCVISYEIQQYQMKIARGLLRIMA